MPRKILAIAATLPLLASCSSYPATAQILSPGQASLIDATCTQIMGLRHGEYQYAQCQESLTDTMSGQLQNQAALSSYGDCRRQGYAGGSGALSACVLDRQNSPAQARMASSEAAPALSYPRNDPDAAESYFNVTPATHWRREQYSCAQLGLVPGSSAFAHCVGKLDADMLPGLE